MADLGREPFDLLVVGGGITGAGVARDAALRGLRVCLLEKGDLASGTSSASSKLVHGGLRYLEQGELRLVFESVSERHRLRALAPHLVRPLPFVFPIYGGQPSPLWLVQTGLWIYDALALFRSYRLHQAFRGERAAAQEPALLSEGLDGLVKYYDCLTDDARLCLETAQGAHFAGAWVMNYAEVVGFVRRRGEVCGAEVRDRRTGQCHSVEAHVVVNATGPWTDRILGLRTKRQPLLRPTKGVHVVVARSRLPVNHAVVLTELEHHRVVFAVPWGSRVMIGTTDTDYQGDYDRVQADRQDVDYLLGVTNHFFPASRLGHSDVLGTYAGLRPLLGGSDGHPSTVSREHLVQEDEDGLITVCGGKLTTYRLMAAQVLDGVSRRLRAKGVHVGGCLTGRVGLPGASGVRFRKGQLVTLGAEGQRAEQEAEERMGNEILEHLRETYGGGWAAVLDRVVKNPELGTRFVADLPYIWAELEVAVSQELTVTLTDFMRRRTQLLIRDARAAESLAVQVAGRMATQLGWDQAEEKRQLAEFRAASSASMAWSGAGS